MSQSLFEQFEVQPKEAYKVYKAYNKAGPKSVSKLLDIPISNRLSLFFAGLGLSYLKEATAVLTSEGK